MDICCVCKSPVPEGQKLCELCKDKQLEYNKIMMDEEYCKQMKIHRRRLEKEVYRPMETQKND